ncbi:MAG: putative dehydrogenase [Psychroserpens sp.]
MKICIIGAGQIAEAHIEEIQKISNCQIVALCDLRKTPAAALAEKYKINSTYTSVDEMLENETPDVVHITTPAGSHFFLAEKALKANSHVYIEKPLTLTASETSTLITLAKQQNLIICPGTQKLYSHETIEAFKQLNNENSFGKMIHMDAVFGYNLQGPFGKLVISNPEHWIAKLPGQLFQNNISHPIAMMAPFLSDDLEISTHAYDLSQNGVVNDELRVHIFDRENKISCTVMFISNASPAQFRVRYFGEHSTIDLNLTDHCWQQDKSPTFPGGLGLSLNIRSRAKQLKQQYWYNFKAFWLGRETFFSDMKRLFEHFYHQINNKLPEPVPYEDIQRTSNIIDKICQQINLSEGK